MINKQHIPLNLSIVLRGGLLLLLIICMEPLAMAQRLPQSRLRGEVFYEEGNYVKALETFNAFEKNNKAILDEPYLRRKAEVYYKLSEFDSAVVCYVRVFKTDSFNVDYHYLWELLVRSSNPDQYNYIEEIKNLQVVANNNWLNKALAKNLAGAFTP